MKIDMSEFKSEHSFSDKTTRALWSVIWVLFFRPTCRFAHAWRCFLLRLFGARIGRSVRVYPSTRVWAPWNLIMGDYSCLGDHVNCYSVGRIDIGDHAMISQYSYLCSATHDITDYQMPLLVEDIAVGNGAWVCADVYVGPGVTIGEGAVAGARSVVVRDVPAWTVVGGNPATEISKRELR